MRMHRTLLVLVVAASMAVPAISDSVKGARPVEEMQICRKMPPDPPDPQKPPKPNRNLGAVPV